MRTVAFGVALACVGGRNAVSAPDCHKVRGKFSLQAVPAGQCASPTGFCATGVYKGDVAGTSAFTGTSIIVTVDTPTTSVIVVTGDNAIESEGGTLTTKDTITLRNTGAGEFAEVDTVISGTGEWAGMTGVLTATGFFTAEGGGEGSYTGQVCQP